MIIAFTGTPGSGKTYDAVRKIVENLRLGRVVYTNVEGMDAPECFEMLKAVTGLSDYGLALHLRFFQPGQIQEFWLHVQPGSMIVLDEVQNVFNARDWQSQKNVQFNTWASTHRHHGFDVVLITQSIQRIDTAVRALVEWTYVYRKVNFFGSLIQKKYICYAYGGEDVNGPPLAKPVRTYDAAIFLCYKSYVSKDVKELGIMKHVNVLKHPVFIAIPIIFGYFIYMLFHSGMIHGDLFGANKLAAQAAKRSSGKPVVASSGPAHKPYSEHTPSIYQVRNTSGQMLFSNRGSEPSDEPRNEVTTKNETNKNGKH
jgi:zona occludens toxin